MKHCLPNLGSEGMSRESIGEFEQLVLLAILRLGVDAYGIPILEEIRDRTGRGVLRPAVYVALRRLEEKRLVRTWLGDPSEQRGGRAKKYYAVEPEGLALIRESRRALFAMWDGIEPQIEES
jgi:PadR family transcriptional regulator PadR